MPLENFEDFESKNAEEMMVKDEIAGRTSIMTLNLSSERGQLSDITNTGIPLATSWGDNQENDCSTELNKSNGAHLQKEICSLRKLLAINAETIESLNNEMQKLWFNWRLASQQNRELVQSNAHLYRELLTDREKLKLLTHEYNQMSAMYKVKILELEHKITELSKELQCIQETRSKELGKNQDEQQAPRKRTSSRESRKISRHKSGDSFNEAESFVKDNRSANMENRSDKRICLRRRSDNVSYKEPSLHTKLRQEEKYMSLPPTSSTNDRHSGSFSGQGTVEKVCDNALQTVTCLPQSETLQEGVKGSKESCGGLHNSSFCSTEVNQTSDVKQQQQETEQASTCMSSLNAVSEETLLSRRSSTGRPVRKATESVASYKEIPINIKLRRPD